MDMLRRLALTALDVIARGVPAGERRIWRDQWRADVWHRCAALERAGLVNARTMRHLGGRLCGAVRHALWLRSRSWRWSMFLQDVRHACRGLLRRPAFTAIAVLTLAVGLGANAVIFSWVEAMLLNPLPGVRDPGSLASLRATTTSRNNLSLSYPNYLDIRDAKAEGIADVAVFGTGALGLRTDDGAERVWGEVVSGNMFQMLGVGAAVGRTLTPEDDRTASGHPVVVISHAFWQRRFGGDPGMVGRSLVLNGQPFTVVGVAEAGFLGTQPLVGLDVFMPIAMQQTFLPGDRLTDRGSGWLQGLVRLAPGSDIVQAQASLDVVARRLAETYPRPNEGRGLRLFELWRAPDGGTSMVLPVMAVLSGIVAILLLLVCSNLAGLSLAKAAGRQRELALRRALGASRFHLVRLLLVESVMLAVAGGALAASVARWSGDLFRAFLPPLPIPVVVNAGLNWQVFAFATGASVLTGILFGALPALQASRPDLVAPLKDGAPMGGAGMWQRGWLRRGLVVAQIALALVLLVSASLFVRTLQHARQMEPGFGARRGVVGAIDVVPAGYDEPRGRELFHRLVDELRALPGVDMAAVGQRMPLNPTDSSDRGVTIDGYTPAPDEEVSIFYASVGVGYLETLQIPLVEGRDFSDRDIDTAPLVLIVNETMARRYWAGRSALGGRVKVGDAWVEVIGVVKDAKYSSLNEPPRPFMYLPIDQFYRPNVRLMVRTAGSPEAAIAGVRQAVQRVEPNLPLFDIQTFEEHVAFAYFAYELVATLLGIFGSVAMLLSALGIYGVIAQSLGQRTREIGVRMSLGATGGDIERLVLRQGGTLALVGITVGVVAALPVTRLFAGQLVGVAPYDASSFVVTVLVLLATTLAACYLPARRASRLDPVRALRME